MRERRLACQFDVRAFSSSEEEQYMMSKAMKRLYTWHELHGNAGEASAFLVIADRKLKMGGTLALVMPLSLMMGEAWEASREVLAQNYSGIILVSTLVLKTRTCPSPLTRTWANVS